VKNPRQNTTPMYIGGPSATVTQETLSGFFPSRLQVR